MAIVQISKLQVRTGDQADLPQCDIGEMAFATDTQNAYIGNDPAIVPPNGATPTNTQLLTNSPNCVINFAQLTSGHFTMTANTAGVYITNVSTGHVYSVNLTQIS